MRTCPNCGELNGDNNSRCYKCNTFIGAVSKDKKKCRDCGRIFSAIKDTCDYCNGQLIPYDENYESYDSKSGSSNTWMYVCTILFPLLGIIFGCIKMSNDKRDDAGKSLIILGVVLMIAYPIITSLFIL